MYNGNVMNLDLYVGGMLESFGGPGPLFTKIIREQFERLRDADRFWFENKENGLFTDDVVSTGSPKIIVHCFWDTSYV